MCRGCTRTSEFAAALKVAVVNLFFFCRCFFISTGLQQGPVEQGIKFEDL